MKILHIISSRGWGGAENSAVYLAKKQIKQENPAFFFIHSFNKKLRKMLEDNGVQFYSIFDPERKNIFAISKIIKICRRESVDIIHTHLSTGNYLGIIAGNFLNIPVASTVNIFSGYPYYAQANAICFCSGMNKKYHLDYFSSAGYLNYRPNFIESSINRFFKFNYRPLTIEELKKKSHVIYERIDESKFIGYNEKLDEFKDYFNIGIIGRIHEQKGQIYFIRAAELLLKEYGMGGTDSRSYNDNIEKTENKPLMFHIVGSGRSENKLKKTVNSIGLGGCFKFWGYRQDVRVIVNTFDICVSCSLNEPFGINNLEYMFMKKPCVATNTGGIPEVFGDTNILIHPKDPVKLKDALKLYIKNKHVGEEEAAKGFERAKNLFISDICLNQVMNVYSSLLFDK